MSKPRALGAEFAGFAAVGVFAFLADVGSFLWLRGPMGMDPMYAKALSFIAGVAVAYTGNALGPYRVRARRVTTGWRRFGVFALVNAAGGAVQLGCLGVSRHVLGLTSTLADVISGAGIGLVLGTAVRFWGTRTLVFAQETAPAPVGRGQPQAQAQADGEVT
ncbi:GtrA family protein [Streptomyces spirodelae]|uniref:GtrA family protein n=1 Tax=Streptomyces spirodelae TaxID=2812904 RepID=A0ABS3WNN1_9ACTN|nr:GtrA family protein [Streptomyces spirodelae]MBO8184728.1 GtrA family protein [Streptomyces spirodelae]